MEDYIKEIKTIPVKRSDPEERSLDPAETKAFRSLVMKLRWPAQKLLTELNRLVKLANEEVQAGRARITHHAINLSQVCIVTYFDASLRREDGCKSRAGMVTFVTDSKALETMTYANRVEHQSKRITRVVKSSLAA